MRNSDVDTNRASTSACDLVNGFEKRILTKTACAGVVGCFWHLYVYHQ